MPGARTTTSTASDFEERRREIVRRLVLVHGASRSGQDVVVIDVAPVVLGRDPDEATLALDDHKVSRRHAVIELDEREGSIVITDQKSRNGTYVDGARRDRAALQPGSVIRVGSTLFVYSRAELGDRGDAPARGGPALRPEPRDGAGARRDPARRSDRRLPVLILGETGVGKELAAGEIHRAERPARGPSHRRELRRDHGERRRGRALRPRGGLLHGRGRQARGHSLAAADGGTLFLDEIGELPLGVQAKLLRALALGEVRPVGSTRPRRVDVRVVAATNRDLASAERDGTFRSDLLSRLSGWTLRIPPLRERREDILPLARRVLRGRPGAPDLSTTAAEALLIHAFPHNVRELEHELGAALARWPGHGPIGVEHLSPELAARVGAGDRPEEASSQRSTPPQLRSPPPAPPDPSWPPAGRCPRARPEPDDLRAVLERFHGNIAQVAAYYGRDRHQVYRWAERLGIDLGSFRAP